MSGGRVMQRTAEDEPMPERRAWRNALQMACDGDEWAAAPHSIRGIITIEAGRPRLSTKAINGGAW